MLACGVGEAGIRARRVDKIEDMRRLESNGCAPCDGAHRPVVSCRVTSLAAGVTGGSHDSFNFLVGGRSSTSSSSEEPILGSMGICGQRSGKLRGCNQHIRTWGMR